jgi:hypothetical protein
MALVINDRVKETSTTTGTGTLTFAGATSGFETFSAGIGNSNTTYYAVVNTDTPTEWEVGLGTLAGDSSTIARTTVISSSNSDSAVDFGAGTKEIFCTLPASKALIKDANGDVSFGDNDITNVGDIAVDTISNDGTDITLDSSGDIDLDAGGGNVKISVGGTQILDIASSSSDVVFQPKVDAKDIKFNQYDGNLLLDINDGGWVGLHNAAAGPGELRFYEDTDLGSNYTGFKAGNATASISYVLPLADATAAGMSLTSDGSGTLSWASAGTSWQAIKTSGYTASAGQGVFTNTSGGAFTVTLPASPTLGDEVSIIDLGSAGTNNVTVGRNSEKIMGSAADMTISTDNAAIKLVYVDGTYGWRLANND